MDDYETKDLIRRATEIAEELEQKVRLSADDVELARMLSRNVWRVRLARHLRTLADWVGG